MFNIGDKVSFISNVDGKPIYGYIVKIEIDPLEEVDVRFEKTNYVFYTVRVYKSFYMNGYADFQRSQNDLTRYEE